MSTFYRRTKNPLTGEFEDALWMDDHFGRHRYGVHFPGGMVYRETDHNWEFETPPPSGTPAAGPSPAERKVPENDGPPGWAVEQASKLWYERFDGQQKSPGWIVLAYAELIAAAAGQGRAELIERLRNPSSDDLDALIRAHCAATFGGCEWPACLPDPDYVCCAGEPDGMRAALRAAADMLGRGE